MMKPRCAGPATHRRPATEALVLVLCAALTGCPQTDEGSETPAKAGEPHAAAAPTTEAAAAPAAVQAPAPTPTAPAKLPMRRFLQVRGTVLMGGEPATIGDELPEAGTIEAQADGYAIITLTPGSVIELRPGTRVTLGTSARKQLSLRLAAGTLWSILPTGASFEVMTQNAIAGVRGTTYFVEASKKGETYVCACDGTVEVQTLAQAKPKRFVSKHQHKGVRVRGLGKKAKQGPHPLANHTDEQAEELARWLSQVGPTP